MSDLGVAIEMASASINGAIMNIKINLKEIHDDQKFTASIDKKMKKYNKDLDELLFSLNTNINI